MSTEKAGDMRPSLLSCTFARVPLNLITRAHTCGMSHKWAVLMYLCRWVREDEAGNMLASCSRSKICEALGISETQARGAILGLRRSGIVSVEESGHNGRATTYRLNVGVTSEHDPTRVGVTQLHTPTDKGVTLGITPTELQEHRGCVGVTPSTPLRLRRGDSRSHPHKNSKKSSYSNSSLAVEGAGSDKPAPRVLQPTKLKPGETLHDLFSGKAGGLDG